MALSLTRSEKDKKREQLRKSLKLLMAFGEGSEEEIHKLTNKLLPLNYETRAGRLYVGSGNPPNWEVQRGGDGKAFCSCPDWKFHAKKKNGDGMCKHVLFSLAMDLEIPDSEAAKKSVAKV